MCSPSSPCPRGWIHWAGPLPQSGGWLPRSGRVQQRLTAAECRGPGGSLHESCCLTRLTLSGSHMPMTTCHPVTESNTSCQCCGQRRRSASTVSSRPWGNCVCPGCMSSEAGRLSVDDDWLGDADANGRLPRHAPPRLLGDGFLQACHLARTSPHCRVTSDLGFRV